MRVNQGRGDMLCHVRIYFLSTKQYIASAYGCKEKHFSKGDDIESTHVCTEPLPGRIVGAFKISSARPLKGS